MTENFGGQIVFPGGGKERNLFGGCFAETLSEHEQGFAIGFAFWRKSATSIIDRGAGACCAFGDLEIPLVKGLRIGVTAGFDSERIFADLFDQDDVAVCSLSPDDHATGAQVRGRGKFEGLKAVVRVAQSEKLGGVRELTIFVGMESCAGATVNAGNKA